LYRYDAVLSARLEEAEARLADSERARLALAAKLEAAVSAAVGLYTLNSVDP
jgi:hypothetical protein